MKALALLNGDPPDCELLAEHLKDSEFIACADGAAHWAYPSAAIDVLVGDMDSIGAEQLSGLSSVCGRVVTLSCEKDETDAQVAVRLCIESGADQIVMLGALGGRFDHALGNVQLLRMLAQCGVRGCIEDNDNRVLAVTGHNVFQGERGKLLSLIPMGEGVTVTTRGLKYPLFNEVLDPALPRGISNQFLGGEAVVEVSGGYCTLVLPKRT